MKIILIPVYFLIGGLGGQMLMLMVGLALGGLYALFKAAWKTGLRCIAAAAGLWFLGVPLLLFLAGTIGDATGYKSQWWLQPGLAVGGLAGLIYVVGVLGAVRDSVRQRNSR